MNLTVKDLIKKLKQIDPDKQVFIQQGGEEDYMAIYSVCEKELLDFETDTLEQAVVLEFS